MLIWESYAAEWWEDEVQRLVWYSREASPLRTFNLGQCADVSTDLTLTYKLLDERRDRLY